MSTEIWLGIAAVVAFLLPLVAAVRLVDQRDAAIRDRDAAKKEADEVNAYLDRFPTLRKMERLLKGDSLAELFELAEDDQLQAMAWGGAALLARGDPQLEELVDKKAAFLAGDCTENDCVEFVADRLLAMNYADGDYGKPKTLTPRQRAVICGVATNGASAFASFLKHATEEKKRERDQLRQQDEAAASADGAA